MRDADVSKIVHIGLILATYANADGSSAWPSVPTLAAVAGCAEDVVSRSLAALVGVGLLRRKRRPNSTAMHTLIIPLGTDPLVWDPHLAPFAKARAAAARRRARSAERARNPVPTGDPEPRPDRERTRVPSGDPEPRPVGGSGEGGTPSRRGTEHRPDDGPEPRRVGGVHGQLLPPVGDPLTDTDVPGPVPQPQVRAREAGKTDHPPGLQALPGGGHGPGGGQAPLLLTVHNAPAPTPDLARIAEHMTQLYGVVIPRRFAAPVALQVLALLDAPADPTAAVIAALSADPDRYRPAIPDTAPAPDRRASGNS